MQIDEKMQQEGFQNDAKTRQKSVPGGRKIEENGGVQQNAKLEKMWIPLTRPPPFSRFLWKMGAKMEAKIR